MLLRLKIVGVHSVVPAPGPPGGHDHGGACAAAPRRRGRSPAPGAARRRRSVAVAMALKEEPESSRRGFAGSGPSWDPGLEIQVPFEQRPVTVLLSRDQSSCAGLDNQNRWLKRLLVLVGPFRLCR